MRRAAATKIVDEFNFVFGISISISGKIQNSVVRVCMCRIPIINSEVGGPVIVLGNSGYGFFALIVFPYFPQQNHGIGRGSHAL